MATKRPPKKASGDCVIPTRPKPEFLRASLVEKSPKEEAEIASYFEWQSSKDSQGPATVEHLELVKSERLWSGVQGLGRTCDGRTLVGRDEPHKPLLTEAHPKPRLRPLFSCRSDGACSV